MKKVINFGFVVILFFVFSISNVFSSSVYSIEVPSTFKKDKSKDYWQRQVDNEKISILVYNTNNEKKLNIEKVRINDINKEQYLDVLKTTFKEKGYKINSYSLDLDKTRLNDYPTIVMDVSSKYTLESKEESIVYQRQYILSSKNYVYYLIVSSSNKDYLDKEEIKNIVNSFKINDEMINKNKEMAKYYMVLTSIVALGIFITFVFSKKK